MRAQSWVTFASDDRDALKALILARSLHQVITRRMITIFVSHAVSEAIIDLLESEFDRCVHVPLKTVIREFKVAHLGFGTVSKLLAWRLGFNKIIFLGPNAVVIKNVDHLFDTENIILSGHNDQSNVHFFIGTPSQENFRRLMERTSVNEEHMFQTVCNGEDGKRSHAVWKSFKIFPSLDTNLSACLDAVGIIIFEDRQHPLDEVSYRLPTGAMSKALHETCLELLHPQEIDFLSTGRVEALFPLPDLKTPNNELLSRIDQLHQLRNSVAIVGMGLRLPKSNTLEEFWELLISGNDGISHCPDDRWTLDRSWLRPDSTKSTQAGFLKCPIDEIDAGFFNLSPEELDFMDPQQRLALQIIWEALENANIDPKKLRNGKVGVFGGWWRQDYKEILQESGVVTQRDFHRSYAGNSLGVMTARISQILSAMGPSVATESGCSTSIVAVDMACKQLIREDNCDVAIAFGVNLLLHPFNDQTLNSIIAPDGHCKTFDAKADGFGRAEGCVALILKRFPDAVRDGDPIHAIIRGSAVVQEGLSRSLGTPTKECEALAMKLALKDARVEAKNISFVETHGTGTPVGDPLEVTAVAEAYATKGRKQPLVIGSVKTNIGHTESCSGIAGIIKSVLSLQHEVIPQHRNFEELNPEIDLGIIPAIIPMQPHPWPRVAKGSGHKPRFCGVSSFGITGTDAHCIIQDPPQNLPPPNVLASKMQCNIEIIPHVIKLSAKTPLALQQIAQSYKSFLMRNKDLNLDEFCYLTNVGRSDFEYRKIVIAEDKDNMMRQLKSVAESTSPISPCFKNGTKITFLFNQDVENDSNKSLRDDTKLLYEGNHTFRFHFDICAKIAERVNLSLLEAGELELVEPHLFELCVLYASCKMWEEWGVVPNTVMNRQDHDILGHMTAGTMPLDQAVTAFVQRIIDNLEMTQKQKRGQKLDQLLTQYKRLKFLRKKVPENEDEIVIAGSEDDFHDFIQFCVNKAKEIKADKEDSGRYGLGHAATVPIVHLSKDNGTIEQEVNEGTHFVVDMATQSIVQSGSVNEEHLQKRTLWQRLYYSLGQLYTSGIDINWESLYAFHIPIRPQIPLSIPGYSFQNQAYWIDTSYGKNRIIHPLLGVCSSNPSLLKLYQNVLSLQITPFLRDHVIGNNVIVPGAGFLEICLVAGWATSELSPQTENSMSMPNAPLSLGDFIIQAPLCIDERTQIQTTVDRDEGSGETRVTIYSRLTLERGTHKWVQHASAIFYPYALSEETENDDEGTLENVKTRCSEQMTDSSEKMYDKLNQTGLKFGPAFRTIQTVWKTEDERETYSEVDIGVHAESYLCHPVVADAMFQAILITAADSKEVLHVPVSVSKFIWYGKLETSSCYIHCVRQGGEGTDVIATLYDEYGHKKARMIGALLVETTPATILAVIDAQRTSLPSSYEMVWREELGVCDKRLKALPSLKDTFPSEFVESLLSYNEMGELAYEILCDTNQLCLSFMLRAWKMLGLCTDKDKMWTLCSLLEELNIAPQHKLYIRFWLTELQKEGFISISGLFDDGDLQFQFTPDIKPTPSESELSMAIENLLARLNAKDSISKDYIRFMNQVGEGLPDVLTNKVSGLSVLFPEEGLNKLSADVYYLESSFTKELYDLSVIPMEKFMDDLVQRKQEEGGDSVLRVLEIGAGTGSITKRVLESLLKKNLTWVDYVYTDLSPAFFRWGEKLFEEAPFSRSFKTLNIEEDPTQQGFIPNSFDLIICGFVIHATENIRTSSIHLRNLLRPLGSIFLIELTGQHPPSNFVFGLVDGFWRFTDRELRPYNCELTVEQWDMVLRGSGFEDVVIFPGYSSYGSSIYAQVSSTPISTCLDLDSYHLTPNPVKTWVVCTLPHSHCGTGLVRRLKEMRRNVTTLILSFNDDATCDITSKEGDGQCYIVKPDAVEENTKQAFDCIRKSSAVEGIVCLWSFEDEASHVSSPVKPFISLCQELLNVEHSRVIVVTKGGVALGDFELNSPFAAPIHSMVTVLQNENHSLACKFLDFDIPMAADVDSIIQHTIAEMCIHDDETAVAYRGNVKHVRRLVSLQLPSNKLPLPPKERFRMILPSSNSIRDLKFGPAPDRLPLGDYDVEIRVKAYALNFRDILVVLKPIPLFENESNVGLDLAGEVIEVGSKVTKLGVGDAVCGFNLSKEALALPSHVTIDENMLVPTPPSMTFAEASTLPAVASTAVVCLINVAKITAADTVLIHTGSGGVGLCAIQIAKAYKCRIVATAGSARKRAYLRSLGVDFIFHSRNTDYASQIRDALGGKGVDVVLNSLTGTGFKEATLSACNPGARFIEMSKMNVWTVEEVKELRPDVQYEIVDLTKMDDEEIRKMTSLVEKYMSESLISPIPYTRFDVTDIRDAMFYMQKAKHIGKIVCIMPSAPKVKLNTSGVGKDAIPLFNERSTYLITGGLGGIGFEVAKWMVTVGAKHVILVGRNQPSDKLAEEIKLLNSKGAHVVAVPCDVGSFEQCQHLIQTIKEGWPPLRGIMHAAGVLSDGLYENQSWSKYMETFHPKVDGGWNLHKLTLDFHLEHFVMFSSMAAVVAPMGQSNHAAANTWLDSFAHYRHSIGLPATTINWGQWGQVGVAANLEVIGTKPMTVFQGISVLESILRNNRLQTCVMEANFNIFRKVMPTSKCLLRELKESAADKAEGIQINADDFWKEYDAAEDKVEVTKKFLKIVVRHILRLDAADGVDDDGQLQDMGMDSLMMIEMKNFLQQVIGNRAKVTVNSVKDCTTVSQLAVRIVQLVSDTGTPFIPTRDELKALIREDAILPESIVEGISQSLVSAPTPPASMTCVMLTGATGNLGPYVLREILLNHRHITKLYCVTSKSTLRETPKERLVKILTQKSLLTPELKNRLEIVECIVGNFSTDDLGFGQELFDQLAKEVDAVFHMGVKSVWQEIYRKDNNALSTDQDIRTINVLGLTKLINFCVRGKMKHIFYPSSILMSNVMDETGRSMETWPLVSDFDDAPNDAYFISKLIGELLLRDAAQKLGLPCKIFRMPMIGGDSKTGANTTPLNNQILLRMMSYMHLGVMPATKFPVMMIPVDTCAELCVDLFFKSDEPDVEVYNVSNPFVDDEQEFEDVSLKLGHPIQIVEREDFIERLEKSGNKEVLVVMKKGLENEGFMTMKQMDEEIPSNALAWFQGDKEVFLSRKLVKALPHKYPQVLERSMHILERDLLHCKQSGVFKKLGLITEQL